MLWFKILGGVVLFFVMATVAIPFVVYCYSRAQMVGWLAGLRKFNRTNNISIETEKGGKENGKKEK